MKCNTKFIHFATSAFLVALPGMVHAGDTVREIAIPSITSAYVDDAKFHMLALNDDASPRQASAEQAIQATEFEPPMFSASNAHKYLGLGTLALVVATAIAPKPSGDAVTPAQIDEQESSLHARFGSAAATLAAATATSGFLAHWDDFHLEDGWTDPDNLHALLGTTGALAMLYAVSKAPASEHAGIGATGGVAMGIAIKLTW